MYVACTVQWASIPCLGGSLSLSTPRNYGSFLSSPSSFFVFVVLVVFVVFCSGFWASVAWCHHISIWCSAPLWGIKVLRVTLSSPSTSLYSKVERKRDGQIYCLSFLRSSKRIWFGWSETQMQALGPVASTLKSTISDPGPALSSSWQ